MSSAPVGASGFDRMRAAATNNVFKSGPLFISSKGIGWKSWKKRWFILTRTSLVFFKNDPSALPQRGGEVNITLGGIDLNNSGSVVVREDKKLLTVLFPDGRDGRAFTLKAETTEDLFEWKTALEHALAQAPNAALVMGHNGIFRNDTSDTFEGSVQQWREKRPVKSLVVGRPILLALEDIDGGPSFLEKALRFLEISGIKVEGVLRQCADVQEVELRVHQYEQGKTEFTADEDAHVVGDCVKHVLRELPSSPVPASCCTALLEAYRIGQKESRVNAMRSAISDTFPEPNRRLLQRILKMMHTIACHTAENRMTPTAVAACMAPLLLRPLLAGECELEDDFDFDGDNSAQLLAAANAANNAKAIITALIEEYENIFDDANLQRCSLSPESQIADTASEESSDDGNLDAKENGYHDAENDVDQEVDDDTERVLSGKLSESSGYAGSDLYDYKVFGGNDSDVELPGKNQALAAKTELLGGSEVRYSDHAIPINKQGKPFSDADISSISLSPMRESPLSMGDILASMEHGSTYQDSGVKLNLQESPNKVNGTTHQTKRSRFWERSARKNLTMESVDSSGEEELAIQRLEIAKNDLRNRILKEAKGNAILQASLERRKQALHERRLALEQDVSRLQEQLQAERDLRAALEVGLSMSSGQFSNSQGMDSKTRAELEEISLAEADVAKLKQKVAELHLQLNHQRKIIPHDFDTTLAFCNQEKKQRSEDNFSGNDRKNGKPQGLPSSFKPPSGKSSSDSISDSKSIEASTSNSAEVNSLLPFPASKVGEVSEYQRQTSVASLALVELTTRLNSFKQRRSQLMEQLNNLELDPSSQGLVYKTSPSWESPR
ncbi:Rho GTPase-activating protein [Zostera marina]|uniref:Rho GTPase-activating protein n=1 Tax=Zostera marina TaxID=29655 RepID=A0A0K9NLF4_ZOSMR|nr:Rho GTPase-activating protein [Zostera marina]